MKVQEKMVCLCHDNITQHKEEGQMVAGGDKRKMFGYAGQTKLLQELNCPRKFNLSPA